MQEATAAHPLSPECFLVKVNFFEAGLSACWNDDDDIFIDTADKSL